MKNIFLIGLFSILFFGCRKNIQEDNITIIKPDVQIVTIASFKGFIKGDNGFPVSGAAVQIGESIEITNNIGKYEFRNIEVNKEKVIIKVHKDDYFLGVSTATIQSNVLSYSDITLTSKGIPQVFSAQEQGILEHQGMTIIIPANSLVDANNTPYQGQVAAFAKYLGPQDGQFASLLPGELIGIDKNNKQSALSAFGVLRTEFLSVSGTKLQLAKDKELEVTFPLTPEAIAMIPPTGIPIWRYNYDLGLWAKADGTCSNSGTCSGYPGTMSICIPFEAIKISGHVYHHDGSPAGSVIASLKGDDTYYRYRWLTDSLGYFETIAPKDMTFEYTIEDHCLNTMDSQSIGGFSVDIDLDNIVLDSTIYNYEFQLSGMALDCNSTTLNNTLVEIRFPGNSAYFFTEPDGSFNQFISFPCSSFPEIIVTAYDIFNKKRSADLVIDVENNINVGNLTTCEGADDYFEFEYADSTYFLFPSHGKYFNSLNPNYKEYNIMSQTQGGIASLVLENFTDSTITTTGKFSILNYNDLPLYISGSTNDINVNITENSNYFLAGNFSGTLGVQTITGTFKARK